MFGFKRDLKMTLTYKGFFLDAERHRRDEIFYEAWRIDDGFEISFGSYLGYGETVWSILRDLKWEVDHYYEYPEFYENKDPQLTRHRI